MKAYEIWTQWKLTNIWQVEERDLVEHHLSSLWGSIQYLIGGFVRCNAFVLFVFLFCVFLLFCVLCFCFLCLFVFSCFLLLFFFCPVLTVFLFCFLLLFYFLFSRHNVGKKCNCIAFSKRHQILKSQRGDMCPRWSEFWREIKLL